MTRYAPRGGALAPEMSMMTTSSSSNDEELLISHSAATEHEAFLFQELFATDTPMYDASITNMMGHNLKQEQLLHDADVPDRLSMDCSDKENEHSGTPPVSRLNAVMNMGKISPVQSRKSGASSSTSVADVLAQLPLPPRSEQQDQKERNRLIVKRCYYKKINTLNELRSEVERNENRYQQLLRQKHAESAKPTSAEDLTRTKTRSEEIHDAYVQLALTSDALRKENEELQRVEAEYVKMEKAISQLHITQNKSIQQAKDLQEYKRRNPIVELRPLSVIECREIAHRAYAQIKAFRESQNNFTTGANIFGWRDRHQVKNNKLMFSLEKTYFGHKMERVSNDSWTLLSTPEGCVDIYSPNLAVHYHQVQRVDDDTIVYYHTLERPDEDGMRIKALMLACRVDLGEGNGVLVLFRGLDPKKYLIREGELPRPRDRRGRNKIEPQKEDFWIDTFVWSHFQHGGPNGDYCHIEFGGIVDGTALMSPSWWMIEKLQIALRLESRVVGQQFILAT